ncbi:hypothetical protein D3C76_1231300 [compost metagenome]
MGQQGRNRGAASRTGTDHNEAAGVAVPGWLDGWQRLVVYPDFIVLHPSLVAAQVSQRWWFADHPVIDGECSLVPRADQQAAADHAFVQWGTCVGAVALVGMNQIALANDDELFIAGLNAQGPVFVELGQAGHGVLGHGVLQRAFGTI